MVVILEKSIANIILNGKRLNTFHQGQEPSMNILSPLLFKIVLKVQASEKDKKRNKRHLDWKRRIKTLFYLKIII